MFFFFLKRPKREKPTTRFTRWTRAANWTFSRYSWRPKCPPTVRLIGPKHFLRQNIEKTNRRRLLVEGRFVPYDVWPSGKMFSSSTNGTNGTNVQQLLVTLSLKDRDLLLLYTSTKSFESFLIETSTVKTVLSLSVAATVKWRFVCFTGHEESSAAQKQTDLHWSVELI